MEKRNPNRVPDDELTFDPDGRARLLGELFTGVAWESPSGGLHLSEVEYVGGLEHGVSTDWYDHETIAVRQISEYGTKHGLEEAWWPNGAPKLRAQWEVGVRVTLERWDERGELVERWALASDDPRRELARKLLAVVQRGR